MNVIDAIEQQARTRPDAIALIRGKWALSYGQMDAAILRIAGHLAAEGIEPRDVVGTAMHTWPLHLLVMLALARLGAVSISVHPDAPKCSRKAAVDHFGVKAIVSRQAAYAVEGCPLVIADPAWMSPELPVPARVPAHQGDAEPRRIFLSSGTTGTPKGVFRPHKDTLYSHQLQRTVMSDTSESRCLCRMDLNTGPNLMRAMRHLSIGGTVIFTEPELEAMLADMAKYGVTHTLAAPIMVARWLRAMPASHPGFPKLKHLALVGGRLAPELGREIAARLTPNIFINYGTTETGLLAVADPESYRTHPESVGRVVPWAEAEVIDDKGSTLPAGQTGILRFRGLGIATGYVGNDEATAKYFRDGWYYPGDLGSLTADSLLSIESRAEEMINLGGPKVSPATVEEILVQHSSVVEAGAFGKRIANGNEVVMAAVVVQGAFDEKALLAFCRERLANYAPVRLFKVAELPRNAMGKLMRDDLARRVITPPVPAEKILH